MRPNLLHPLADRRPARRQSRRTGARQQARAVDAPARSADPVALTAGPGPVDAATERVRDAGGPIDRASYACGCGLLFQAKVSTTVICPHCGAGQAW
jgi:hypothetical protein